MALLEQYHALKQEIEETREAAGLAEMEEQLGTLKAQIDDLVVQKGNVETDGLKITKVQGFKRTWDIAKLEKILPRAVFRRVVVLAVDKDKLDLEVRAGHIEDEQIKPAFVESPNKAYARWTYLKDDSGRASAEADSLAEQLG